MVKRKLQEEEEFDAYDALPQPAFKRIAIRTEFSHQNQGQMDVEMDAAEPVETPNDEGSPNFSGAYPPTTQSLYPFPQKGDDMDMDGAPSSPESSSPLVRSGASDPVHGHIVDNRYPSNASSVSSSAMLQPRTRNTSCACPQIPKLVLANYGNEEGKRTMWSHCQSCGAMDLVLKCDGQPVLC